MKDLNLIPQPYNLKMKKGCFTVSEGMFITASEEVFPIAESLKKEIKEFLNISLVLKKINPALPCSGITLGKAVKGFSLDKQLPTELGKEGYILDIDKGGVIIKGKDSPGVFYGTQTLLQLIENGPEIPCMEIKDRPALELRGVHLMLMKEMPRYEYLKAFIRRISRYKINTILLEYEDKFPYKKHSILRHPLALTEEQIREFLKLAKEHYVEVIPLVQCFAHVSYILKHKEYSHLREVEDNPYQYCVSKEESLNLFKDLASEVLSLHKDAKYFHVGADETYYMGFCPKCRKEVEKIGKSRFFLNHIKKVSEFVKKAGKIPIIWGDQLVWYPENIDSFPKDIYVMYWDYTTGDEEKVPFFKWDNRIWFGEEIFERIPTKIISLFKRYWDNGEFPKFNRPFPYLHFYREKGLKVIGAPSIKSSGTGNITIDNRIHVPNIRGFARKIADNKEIGIVSTEWPGSGGILETAWHGIAATGEFAWSPGTARSNFDKKFTVRFFKTKNTELTRAIYLLGGDINPQNIRKMEGRIREALSVFTRLRPGINKNQLMIDCLALNGKMQLHLIKKIDIFEEVERKIIRFLDYSQWEKEKKTGNRGSLTYKCFGEEENSFSRENLEKMVYRLRELRDEIPGLKDAVRDLYSRTIEKSDVEEIISSLYREEEKAVEAYISELNYLIAVRRFEEYKERKEESNE